MKPEDVERIHEASLRILDEVGVRLEHDGIVARLVAAGARRGSGPNDVRLPPAIVREHLALAPRKVELAARDGTTTLLDPESKSVFWTTPVLYLWTGTERRPVTSADLLAIARLSSRLDAVQGVMGVAMADVSPLHRDFVGLRVIAEGTRKHARVLCFSPRGMDALVRMKPVFPGPWFSIGFTAHGPLRWTNLALEVFARASAALGRFYGLPSSSWVSTESVFEDEQAALETMFGLVTHMQEGVSLVWGLGQLESEMTLSLAQLVIDDEMVAYVRRHREVAAARARELLAGETEPTMSDCEREALLAVERAFAGG